ncbi:MAG: hypothetical protein BAJALOKI1v1_450004 [Promethearchaeota archaeon]|nr:MAG: hypothetical protein BAJALOKI1v1_450004 [Candidatus Lokiarchaeota archaeon]
MLNLQINQVQINEIIKIINLVKYT